MGEGVVVEEGLPRDQQTTEPLSFENSDQIFSCEKGKGRGEGRRGGSEGEEEGSPTRIYPKPVHSAPSAPDPCGGMVRLSNLLSNFR